MQTKEIVLVLSLVIFITMTIWQITTTVYSVQATTEQEAATEANYQLWKNARLTGNTELFKSFTNEEHAKFTERYFGEKYTAKYETDYQAWKAEREQINKEIIEGYCVLAGDCEQPTTPTEAEQIAKPTQQLCEGRYYNGIWTGTDCIEIPSLQKKTEWEQLKLAEELELEKTREEWRQACAEPGTCTIIE